MLPKVPVGFCHPLAETPRQLPAACTETPTAPGGHRHPAPTLSPLRPHTAAGGSSTPRSSSFPGRPVCLAPPSSVRLHCLLNPPFRLRSHKPRSFEEPPSARLSLSRHHVSGRQRRWPRTGSRWPQRPWLSPWLLIHFKDILGIPPYFVWLPTNVDSCIVVNKFI